MQWSKEQIREIYFSPLLDLIFRAASIHRENHKTGEVQVCTLLSIKTGGCPENCSYCPQSAHHQTEVVKKALLNVNQVLADAKKAKEAGSTRFCMGAAWRQVKDGPEFDRVLEMVKGVGNLGLEVCATLGMLTESQAKKLEEAGLHAYNHNVDTSSGYYEEIISTRNYQDRLNTIANVRKTKVTVCSGGIIGMGETDEDRIGMIYTLANLPQPPESVPINALVPVKGTPLENQKRVSVWDMVRMIATARITMPTAQVRLSAGRLEMPISEQALCFMAGANSIFTGEKLLTTPNPEFDQDKEMFQTLGLTALIPKNSHKILDAKHA